MARTPSSLATECEMQLGGFRPVEVNSGNRTIVRRWLTAQGIPSHIASGLSLAELQQVYNDNDAEQLDRLRSNADPRQTKPQASTGATDDAAAKLAQAIKAIADVAAAGVVPQATEAAIDEEMVRVIVLEELEKVGKLPLRVVIAETEQRAEKDMGLQHQNFPRLLKMCGARDSSGNRLNVWIAGPAGSGKTKAAECVAEALGLSFTFNGALDNPYGLLGFRTATGETVRTPFREAFEHGGVYLFDEIDGSSASALLALNAALANGKADFPDGTVSRHADFVCIAAGNTYGHGATAEYIGRNRLDAASLNRFVKLPWDYDEALELAIAGDAELVRKVQNLRQRAKNAAIRVVISPRDSINGAALVRAGFTITEAIEATVGSGMTADQRSALGL